MHAATPDELRAFIKHVRPLYRTLEQAVESRLADTGLTVGMRAVLEQLDEGGPQTVPQIASSLMTGRQFIQRVVNDLMEQRLVTRVANPHHRRSWLIQPTPAGAAFFREIRARELAVIERVASLLNADDLAAARRCITQITAEFQRERT